MRGGRIKTVESGSMVPRLSIGDAVILSPVNPTNLSVDDIVNYRSPRNLSLTITHRIVHIDRRARTLTTRGDALNRNDLDIGYDSVLGKAVAVAPNAGKVLDALHRPLLLVVVVYVPALAVVFFEMRRLVAGNETSYRYPSYRC